MARRSPRRALSLQANALILPGCEKLFSTRCRRLVAPTQYIRMYPESMPPRVTFEQDLETQQIKIPQIRMGPYTETIRSR